MKVGSWLRGATKALGEAGIGTARLDALVLLEDVTGKNRGWLLANPEHKLSAANQAKLTKLLNQRVKHTPLAYVRGTTEFYGRNFVITSAVLEPRPESEAMIELLKQLSADGLLGLENGQNGRKTLKIADVGAGSGALGITAKLELGSTHNVVVELLEIDPEALKVAGTNVEKHTTNISVIRSDLLTHSSKDYDVLLCNLPYVPDSHTVNEAASHEPKIAIFGGPNGLDIYRKLFDQIRGLQKQPLYILTESLPPQHETLTEIAGRSEYRLEQADDFIQVFVRKP